MGVGRGLRICISNKLPGDLHRPHCERQGSKLLHSTRLGGSKMKYIWYNSCTVTIPYHTRLFWGLTDISHIKLLAWCLVPQLMWSLVYSVFSVRGETNSHGIPSPVKEKGRHGHSLKRRVPWALPWQAFIAFLGTLPWGWSSFTIHRLL